MLDYRGCRTSLASLTMLAASVGCGVEDQPADRWSFDEEIVDTDSGVPPDARTPTDTRVDPDLGSDTGSDAGELHHASFVGNWLVDQPTHALYEASWYRFDADGTVELVDTAPSELGSVSHCARRHADDRCIEHDITCTFGDRWRSRDGRRLEIEGECDDGASRWIHFVRSEPDSDELVLDSVSGTSEAWSFSPGFYRKFARCEVERCGEAIAFARRIYGN